MTEVRINKDTITISGHSGYSYAGSDPVCAYISAYSQYFYNLNSDKIDMEEDNGYYKFSNIQTARNKDLFVFKAVMKELSNLYPANIRVIEKL